MASGGHAGSSCVGLIACYITGYTSAWPKVVTVTTSTRSRGRRTSMLQTDGAIGEKLDQKNPDWVSYLIRSHGEWVHTTICQVPAHALIHVTIYQYDSESGLRNPFLGQVQGTVGGTMTLDGKTVNKITPEHRRAQLRDPARSASSCRSKA